MAIKQCLRDTVERASYSKRGPQFPCFIVKKSTSIDPEGEVIASVECMQVS